MNVIEAAKMAKNGERIMTEERGEWIEYIGGIFRYVSNREEVKFSMRDIASENWISEKDFIITYRERVSKSLDIFYSSLSKMTIESEADHQEQYEKIKEIFLKSIRIERQNEVAILKKQSIIPNEEAARNETN
jgi:hypothetical protein